MKKIIFLILLITLLPSFSLADSPLSQEEVNKIVNESNKGKSRYLSRNWLGKEAYFLTIAKSLYSIGKGEYQGSFIKTETKTIGDYTYQIPYRYDELVGHRAVVKAVFKDGEERLKWLLVDSATNNEIWYPDYLILSNMEEVVFLEDLNGFNNKLKGKVLWNKGAKKMLLLDKEDQISVKNIEKLEVLQIAPDFIDDNSYSCIGIILKTSKDQKVVFAVRAIDDFYKELAQNFFFENPLTGKKWPKKAIEAIKNGEIYIGMNKEQAIMSWGQPSDINKTMGSWGVHEQWIYGVTNPDYVYFENGILKSWQD